MALQEFRSNKLRTLLSLLGITFGIFCIISVLATVASMKEAVQSNIKALGSNAVVIDKWEWVNSNDYPWWRFVKRPDIKPQEVLQLRERVPSIRYITLWTQDQSVVEHESDRVSGVTYYGVGVDYAKIEHFNVAYGYYPSQNDFDRGANVIVVGYNIATKLFDNPEKALGKTVILKSGKPALIVGVIAKQGQSFLDMWQYDDCIILPSKFLRQMTVDQDAQPRIIAEAMDNMPIASFKDELTGGMRSIRKLPPGSEDNYSLNDVQSISQSTEGIFTGLNQGGWAIAALSLIVGMFGVANIMFVTVRERTSQIGLKKALGAKKNIIVAEFLLESSFLCIIGGLIGLVAVFILSFVLSSMLHFTVFVPGGIIALAVGICLFVGIAAGIIPALSAARLDPVVAIRSTT